MPDPAPMPVQRSCPFDPPEQYRRLRAEAPVSRLALPGGKTGWLVTRYREVRAMLADERFRTTPIQASPIRQIELSQEELRVPPGMFAAMDPPEHTQYRKLLAGQFTMKRMRQLTPRIAQIVDEHLDSMAQAGPPVDLVDAFALPIPSLVICELLGVPYAEQAEFQRQTATLLSLSTDLDAGLAAHAEMNRFMRSLVLAKRKQPADDLLSRLIHDANTDQPLTDEELINIGTLLLLTGHETTMHMLSLGVFVLLEHPNQLAALRADPALLDGAIEELLRYLTIIQFGVTRIARADLTLGDQRILAGDVVVASLSAANRDADQFPEPDRFDVHRDPSSQLALGHGVHFCLGAPLARVEMKVAFEALFGRFPTLRLAVPAEQVPMRNDTAFYGVHALPVTWDDVRH